MAVLFLAAVFLTGPMRADADPARADYQNGVQYQQAKQYGRAIRAYLKAIQENPNYVGVYKSVGTCYYYAGDKRGALYYYRIYLRSYPNDQATASFVQSLEGNSSGPGEGSSASSDGEGSPSHEPASREMTTGFDFRLGLGGLYNDGSDVNTLITSEDELVDPDSSTSLSGGLGDYFAVGGDYVFQNGFLLGLDICDGPSRTYTVTVSDGAFSDNDNLDVTSFSFFVSPGWRFQVAPKILLEARVGLGDTSSTLTSSNDAGSSTASANGFSAWPVLRGEYEMGAWGIGLSLGYLICSLSPVTSSVAGGGTLEVVNSDGSSSNWTLDNSGPTFGLDLTYHLGMKE